MSRRRLMQGSRARKALKVVLTLIAIALVSTVFIARKPIGFVLGGGLQLPTPDGSYAVGRVSQTIVDESRDETFTDAPDDKRVIRADIYYPAVAPERPSAGVYVEAEIAEAITGVPAFATRPITPNWTPNAAPDYSGAPYPVLMFSPGFDTSPIFYTSLLEHLTSRGYVVVALWHTYSEARTLLADGTIIESNFNGNGVTYEGTEEEQREAKRVIAHVWADDTITAMDHLTELNAGKEFNNFFDVDRIGAFGHSHGGQNAAAAMTLDGRIRAGINMDGTSRHENILDKGVEGAFAFVYDTFEAPQEYLERENMSENDWWATWTPRNCPPAIREHASEAYIFQIDNLRHMGFGTDLVYMQPLFGPFISDEMVGTIGSDELLPLLTNLIDDFFDIHLSNEQKKIDISAPGLHEGIKGHPTLDGPNPPPSPSSRR